MSKQLTRLLLAVSVGLGGLLTSCARAVIGGNEYSQPSRQVSVLAAVMSYDDAPHRFTHAVVDTTRLRGVVELSSMEITALKKILYDRILFGDKELVGSCVATSLSCVRYSVVSYLADDNGATVRISWGVPKSSGCNSSFSSTFRVDFVGSDIVVTQPEGIDLGDCGW